MNKEEVRKARLRALGLDPTEDTSIRREDSDPDTHPAEKKERTDEEHDSSGSSNPNRDSVAEARAAPATIPDRETTSRVYSLPPSALTAMTDLLISGNTNQEDMVRWFSQGCQFIDNPNYFLRQTHGGPCGVLAAIQAEIVKHLYFGQDRSRQQQGDIPAPTPIDPAYDSDSSQRLLQTVSRQAAVDLFSAALYAILRRAMTGPEIRVVFCDLSAILPGAWPQDLKVQEVVGEAAFGRFVQEHMSVFESESGCVLITLSLLLTRGVEAVARDMDDPTNGLIGNFGHCNQELVNLLLTGHAVSNVFDGSKPLGESGMVLNGIIEQSDIGYLTHLESMRYCQVGSFYKVPRYPIWVVGSSSHFTVLFSLDERVNAETHEEMLLSRVKREFRQADSEENGYIPMDRLRDVLIALSIDVGSMSTEDFNSVKLLLDPETCGIILWGVFWAVVSQLMSGTRIDHLLDNFSKNPRAANSSNSAAINIRKSIAPTQRERSDSEIARALQDEWNGGGTSVPEAYIPENPAPGMVRSDSDLARALQQEWDGVPAAVTRVGGEANSRTAATSAAGLDIMSIISSVRASSPAVPAVSSASSVPAETEPSARNNFYHHDSMADENSEGYVMFHYNGLFNSSSNPQLTMFILQKRVAMNDVGLEVALDTDFGGIYAGINSNAVEELLKTRWPGCRLRWTGEPAKID